MRSIEKTEKMNIKSASVSLQMKRVPGGYSYTIIIIILIIIMLIVSWGSIMTEWLAHLPLVTGSKHNLSNNYRMLA